ncbi:MAG TPA: hypothetical protein VF532_07725 [Candidatus Angelobacter sp.]
MNRNFPEESTIRQYLLGRLDEQEELETSLSLQILSDDKLAEIVDSIEDEIIEDYLDGTLSAADKNAADTYFLRSPERNEKVHFARLLRSHLEKKASSKSKAEIPVDPVPGFLPAGGGRVDYWRSHFRTYCEIAALIILTAVSIFYISTLQHRFESNQAQLKNELAKEREHSANLFAQLQQKHPETLNLPTFFGVNLRAKANDHKVKIGPTTKFIHVEVNVPSGFYDVRLESTPGSTTWFQARLGATSYGLVFDFPAQAAESGDNCLEVTQHQPNTPASEQFCFWADR